jgi:hypothetical protein
MQFDFKKVTRKSLEANDRFMLPSKVFDLLLRAAEDQDEVDKTSYTP